MEESQARFYLGKKVYLVLTNQYKYSGEIIDVSSSALAIIDKFGCRVSISLNEIVVCTEVQNGGC